MWSESEFTGNLGVSWDATPVGVPVSGEVSGSRSSSTANTIEYGGSGDIVLGVKINKVVTYWGTANGETIEQLRGTVLDNESPEDEKGEEIEVEIPVGFGLLDEETTVCDVEDAGAKVVYKECVEDDNQGNCILLVLGKEVPV